MINECGSFCLPYLSRGSELCSLRTDYSTRKLNPFTHLDQCNAHSYPSPPMSSPPSPPRFPQDRPASTPHDARVAAAATAPTTTAFSMPTAALTSATYDTPLHTPRTPGPFAQTQTTTAAIQISQSFPAYSTSQTLPTFGSQPEAGPASLKGGRKSKAHVASACINCKRAHLSCDVNRPCARCVSSGKQVSCSFSICMCECNV